jgi:hypothetical protein
MTVIVPARKSTAFLARDVLHQCRPKVRQHHGARHHRGSAVALRLPHLSTTRRRSTPKRSSVSFIGREGASATLPTARGHQRQPLNQPTSLVSLLHRLQTHLRGVA